ncbi:MAG: hypothetical protein IJ833_01020 [Lachnospiraceae bacterium]|nr:hypothetical protein [Lachnospiraceae bacterium]
MRKQRGTVSELLAAGICILAMTVVMMAYMGSVALIQQKSAVSQIARKYILRMETVGYLTREDESKLQQELADVGVTGVDLTGSTVCAATYGAPITLCIKGKLKEQYEFEERRVSTAKN